MDIWIGTHALVCRAPRVSLTPSTLCFEKLSNLNLGFPNCVKLMASELQKFSCFCFPTTANTLQLWPFKWVLGFNTSLHDCWVIILPTKPFSRSNSVILSKVNSLLDYINDDKLNAITLCRISIIWSYFYKFMSTFVVSNIQLNFVNYI